MAGHVQLNVKVFLGGYDFSGDHNAVALDYGAEMLDETTYRAGVGTATRRFKPGLKTFSFNGTIFWNTVNDGVLFNRIGAAREVMSWAPVGESEGDTYFLTRGVNATYNPVSGEIGQLLSATLEGRNSNQALVRGRVMKSNMAAITTTGQGAGVQIGSAANKHIYSALHVFSPAVAGGGGEQVIVTIESDDNAGFATPTTRLTHATKTALGADWQEAAIGAGVTDTYWRAVWTVAGATPNFLIAVGFGIL